MECADTNHVKSRSRSFREPSVTPLEPSRTQIGMNRNFLARDF